MSTENTHRTRWGRGTLSLLALTVFAAAVAVASLGGSAAAGSDRLEKVAAQVRQQLERKDETTVWVILRDKADLSPAFTMPRNARGRFVYERLTAAAERSQAGLRRLLRQKGVAHRPFWIVNAIHLTANEALLQQIAARPEVDRILPEQRWEIPKPLPGTREAEVNAVEWNVDRIRAPDVWSAFGDRGEGVVVANIDTGVDFDHPALVEQYRGNVGNGDFDHNYNWFDPARICGDPSLAPCDNHGHGTHTMGTMVGDDGDAGQNQIGVAPRARWIAAKGCESGGCSGFALISSGQWILAPTDLNGENPRPDLRPDVVNNSWSGGPGDFFYQATVDAWIASGIFPAFANGNNGPGCSSSGSPGDYVSTYSAGAFDSGNEIASFSSRGPSAEAAETKPNAAAPGVNVRSSVPGIGYDSLSGTSMASPHVAATVALVWSAAPTLAGDVSATRTLLDDTAIDAADLACGGTDDDNNVWGEGRLDAFAAVQHAPRGPTGTLEGTVTDVRDGSPVAGASIHVTGPVERATTTDGAGGYRLVLPVASYGVTANAFGYLRQSASDVAISDGATTTQNFALGPAPTHRVSGYVRDGDGDPIEKATVALVGTPIPLATTGADGAYSFAAVPDGEYDVRASAGRCHEGGSQHLVVDGDESLDFALVQRSDGFGYFCRVVAPDYVEATAVLPLNGDDDVTTVDLPFPVTFYGGAYSAAYVTTNGFVNFLRPDARYFNEAIPSPEEPNAAIYPYWDDLVVDAEASVRTELLGEPPSRRFVIEWRNVARFADVSRRVDFEVVLYEDGRILMQYRNIAGDAREQGEEATIGIEDEAGAVGLQYSFHAASIESPEFAVLYALPPSGFVQGHVTDANDSAPVVGARVRGLRDGAAVRETSTDGEGFYRLQLPLGTYTVEATSADYGSASAEASLGEDGQVLTRNLSLHAARIEVTPAAVEFVVPTNARRTTTLTLGNTGSLDLEWRAGEARVAAVADGGEAGTPREGVSSRTPSAGYAPNRVNTVLAGGPTLVFMDALPWGSEALRQVLTANGIPFDTANSSQMATIDLSRYDVVFLANDQPAEFYARYDGSRARFEDYVAMGGFLWVGAAAWGFNGGDFNGGVLPGGVSVRGPVFEGQNDVVDNAHPTMQGVPDPFFGTEASHAAFENVPGEANVIARGQESGLATLVEYEVGAGRVLALGQTLEFGFEFGQDPGRILENGVPYAYRFEPIVDVPWLSAEPSSGTLSPGASQAIRVTVDATGLQPGLYRAHIVIRSNDPRNRVLLVPVTLVVSAYDQAVNVGGGGYTDVFGDEWSEDQEYASGSWGYTSRNARSASTRRAISGTDDDPLYQDLRQDPIEYRFDGIAPGTYEITLDFAELGNRRPGTRLFDVIVEGDLVLPAHDIAAEVGSFAADRHVFFKPVTDSALNIRFVERRGYAQPIVSAIRVTHRPDR